MTIKKFWLLAILLVCLVGGGLWQCSRPGNNDLGQPTISSVAFNKINQPIQPIPMQVMPDRVKVQLGEMLFHDPQLSSDNTISCASCHDLKQGGTDRLRVSIGVNGALGTINAPTVFNCRFNDSQFWDGRVETLEEQIDSPIQARTEMASTWPEVIRKLRQSSEYSSRFKAVYDDGITQDNIKDAIATFERSLITPNSRFDRFLNGDGNAITAEEKEGYRRFRTYGCVACHQGVNVGGNMFHDLGVFGDYFKDRGNITQADFGRYNVTGEERDRYVFKVPSLRNVVLTAPYFHDGSATTLKEAVQTMGKYQLGRELSDEDTTLIIRFLVTLTGKYRGEKL